MTYLEALEMQQVHKKTLEPSPFRIVKPTNPKHTLPYLDNVSDKIADDVDGRK